MDCDATCSPRSRYGATFSTISRHTRLAYMIALLGLLGVLSVALQWTDTAAKIVKGGLRNSQVTCMDQYNANYVRTRENSWGVTDSVIISKHCEPFLARNVSSDPMKWLDMCNEFNGIYNAYAASNEIILHNLLSEANSKSLTDSKKPSILVIGDSLDNYMIQSVCNLVQGKRLRVDLPEFSERKPYVCTSPVLEIGFLNIFGMARTCKNGRVAHLQDNRPFETTVDRVNAILPDVLEKFETKPNHVQISSALWDLSDDCVTRNGVPKAYREYYASGMKNLHDFLLSDQSGLDDDIEIFWRTSPPMTKWYSARFELFSLIPFNVKAMTGRTIHNQRILNDVMLTTAHEEELGSGVIDWWEITHMASGADRHAELPDGRHYSFCSSMTFFNELLSRSSIY